MARLLLLLLAAAFATLLTSGAASAQTGSCPYTLNLNAGTTTLDGSMANCRLTGTGPSANRPLDFASPGFSNTYDNNGTTNTARDDRIIVKDGNGKTQATVTMGYDGAAGNTNPRYSINIAVAANAGGQVKFNVQVTDTNAEVSIATYTLNITPKAPAPQPLVATVAYGSSNTTLTPTFDNTNAGPATSVAVVTPPTNGTVTVSGLNFLYTPSAATYGSDTFTFTASNSGGTSSTQTATITITEPTPTVTAVAPTAGPVAGGNSVTITGTNFARSGPSDKPTVKFGTVTVPDADVTYSSPTQLTAKAPAAGGASVTNITVTNTNNTSATGAGNQYTYAAAPVANAQSVTVAYNTATSITLTASNTPTSYAYTQPAANTGTVTGTGPNVTYTPPAGYSGTTTFTFTASNAGGTSSAATVTVTVSPPPAPAAPTVTAPANGATVATATPTVTGTTAAGTTVAIYIDGALNGSATVSGSTFTYTPSAALGQGSHTVYAVASNAGGPSPNSAANTFTVDTIAPAAPTITAPANGATVGTQTPQITGTAEANSRVSVSIDGGAATVVNANAGGAWSFQQPTALGYGNHTISAVARDAADNASPAATSGFIVAQAPAVTSSPANQTAAVNATVTFTAAASGTPSPTVQWQSSADGATYSDIAGATSASYTFTATAADNGKRYRAVFTNAAGSATTSAAVLTVVQAPTANNQTVPVAYGTATSLTLTGSDPNTPPRSLTYEVLTGTAHGTLSGTAPNLTYSPNASYNGADSFTFRVNNGSSTSSAATVTLNVGGPTITVSGTPPQGQRGAAYSAQLTASGGAAPYTFRVASGSLPPGLTITSGGANGTIGGTPTASGSFQVAFTVTDSSNPAASTTTPTYTIQIAAPAASLAPAAGALPASTVGASYSQTITTSGTGTTAPYSYAATGTLPAGLTLSSGGVLSGTPTMAGDYSFAVTSTDSSTAASGGPYTTSANYTLHVNGAAVVVTPAGGFPNGQVGAAYSQQASASGGTAPYTFSITGGALPAGVTLASNGVLSGTPTAGGAFTFTLSARDSSTGTGAPFSGARQYTLTIGQPTIAIAPDALADGNVNISYTQSVTASGGTAPYSYAVSAGALPAGLTLSSSGTLAGKPTQAGNYTFTIRATDSSTGAGPYAQTRTYTLAITAPTITVAPATLPNAKIGAAYSQTFTASGGSGGYGYAIVTGALPAGVSLATGGVLSGTPTAGGSFTFTVRATDSNGNAGSRSYTLTADAATIAIAPDALPDATTQVAYSQSIAASGGTAPYSYAVTAGALPAGVTLASNGTLSGKPTSAGQYTFTVTARDASTGSGPYTQTKSYTLTVAAVAIAVTPATLPDAITRTAYSQQLTATGGTAPFSYAVTAGALPAGISLSVAGRISGTATTAGSFNFTVTATDANGNAGAKGYTLTVAAPAITIAPTALPDATARVAYSQTLTANGGTAPYGYAVTAGALPAGITLTSGGVLSGSAAAAGQFSFTVTATDANGNSGAKSYTLTVAAPAITIAPAVLPDATARVAYSQQLTASGGTAPYAYAVTAGALPAGLTLTTGGALSGSATAAGQFSFTVTATDTNGNAGAKAYTLTVAAPAITLAPATLPNGTTKVAYSQTLTASGGTAPYGFAVTAGALPTGLTLATNGALSGTPTAAGSFNFTATATDANGNAGGRAYTITVVAPAIALAPQTLPAPAVGTAYNATVTASGGTAPYSFAVTAGALPTGIALGADGTFSGTPSAGGSFTFTVTGTDASGNTGARSYTLTVATAAVTIAPTTLPAAQSGMAYSQTLSASGGTAPYSYAVTAGALPVGLTLSTNGTLSGSATQSGSFTFSVTATDASTGSGPYSGTRSYTLQVSAPTLALSPATLAGATVGAAYSGAITASGGTAPYTYAVSAGALPAGVTLSANGALAGTPTAGGSFGFTVSVTDSTTGANGGPYTASRSYTLQVAAATVAIAPATLPDGQYQVAYSQALTASGGTAPYVYTVTAGALPAGLTLSTAGALSGTPTAFGSFDFTVTATDSSTGTGPYAGGRSYTLVIAAPAKPTAGNVGASVAYGSTDNPIALQLGGGAATSVAVATAPAHGTATASGTTITYTPAAGYAGSDSFTYTASNAGGTSAPGTVSVTVAQPTLTLTPATLPAGQQDVAYTQQLTASGGAAPYSYAVTGGRLPNGVALTTSGLLTGTPRESGRFAVTVTATDGSTGDGPFTVAKGYTLDIALPAAPVARPGTASVAESTTAQSNSVAIDLSALVTGNYTAIRITTQPQHGTVSIDGTNAQRTIATYTPAVGYIGADGFGYTAVGSGGNSNEARIAVTVTGVAPIASALKTDVANGQTVTIDLTGGAFGGPFTGATIVAVSPADSLDATVVEGGSATARTYALKLTPRGRFSGTATVSYTLTNAYGTSAPAVVTVTVAQRADPSQDATVSGISAAQAEATRRFAQAQLDNFQRRNEQLHNGGAGSQHSPIGISVSGGNGYLDDGATPYSAMPDVVAMKMEHATAVLGAERSAGLVAFDRNGQPFAMTGIAGARGGRGAPGTLGTTTDGAARARNAAATGNAAVRDPESSDAIDDAAHEGNERRVGSAAIWSGGAVAVGTRDATRRRGKLTVSTGGLSAGVDVKLAESLTLGVGGGYGADRTRIGENRQGRVDGDSWMGAAYGSYSPADGLFIDGVAGGGRLSFDTIRKVDGGLSIARGHRGGSMMFGSLTGGFDRTSDTHALSVYGRVDYLSADLDRYGETGAGNANLAFAHRDLTSLSSVFGLRGSILAGAFVPRIRAEWRHEFKDGGVQALDYADLPGFNYAIRDQRWLRNDFSLELGTDYVFDSGWRLGFDLGGALGQGSQFATGKVTVRKQF